MSGQAWPGEIALIGPFGLLLDRPIGGVPASCPGPWAPSHGPQPWLRPRELQEGDSALAPEPPFWLGSSREGIC